MSSAEDENHPLHYKGRISVCLHETTTKTRNGEKCNNCGITVSLPEIVRKVHDLINNPAHYTRGRKIQPIDVFDDWKLNPWEANAIKYISRHRLKNGKEDLQKAIWYIEDLIKREYGED